MKEITLFVNGKKKTVKAQGVGGNYAVFRDGQFFHFAQNSGEWIIEATIHELLAPRLASAIVSLLDYEEKYDTGFFPTA